MEVFFRWKFKVDSIGMNLGLRRKVWVRYVNVGVCFVCIGGIEGNGVGMVVGGGEEYSLLVLDRGLVLILCWLCDVEEVV